MNLQSSMNSLLAMTMGATAYTSQMKSKQLQQQKQDKFNEDKLSAIQQKTEAINRKATAVENRNELLKKSTQRSIVEAAYKLNEQKNKEARELRLRQMLEIERKKKGVPAEVGRTNKYGFNKNTFSMTGSYFDEGE